MESVQLKGVQYVTDSAGKRTAVLISLEEWGELWEDIYKGRASLYANNSRLLP